MLINVGKRQRIRIADSQFTGRDFRCCSRKEEGEWQTGGEEDKGDPEKKIQKCSALKMGEKKLTLTT